MPRLTEAIVLEALAAGAVSRDLCGRTLVYLQARGHYGVCDPARLGRLPALWAQVLGEADLARLDDLSARVIWAKDGDNESLDRYADEYRKIIGPPPPPLPGSSESEDEASKPAGNASGGSKDGASEDASGQAPSAKSLGEALEQAVREQRLGLPDGYRSHTLHVEPNGSFSIVALVWRPGQLTRIHDRLSWWVFGVIQGVEHEELFDDDLSLVAYRENHVGDVNGFAPPDSCSHDRASISTALSTSPLRAETQVASLIGL